MVTEESSVVAAASAGARFWAEQGGFRANVKGRIKIGQIHFCWYADPQTLKRTFTELKSFLLTNTSHLTSNMEARGGGVKDIELIDFTHEIEDYYQLKLDIETGDTMGANFINTLLEEMALLFKTFYMGLPVLTGHTDAVEIIMSILSNYTPGCIVESNVECNVSDFNSIAPDNNGREFARRFRIALEIAKTDPFRAVTHNKGIFNGMDAVILATGNDFRAIEAAGHAFASRSKKYTSLSDVEICGDTFSFHLQVPMAIGITGGLTSLHPMAKWSFEILNNPTVEELMMIIASVGLASNFSAIKALTTTGIQQGHMKLHLGNFLSLLNTTRDEQNKAKEYFSDRKVTHFEVRRFIEKLRKSNDTG
jgi:hydroxymethylglutaryl-CoA reductase